MSNKRPNKKTNRRDGARKKHTALLPDMVDGIIPDLRPVPGLCAATLLPRSEKVTANPPTAAVSHVTPADGNVFEDLGFPKDEAEHMLAEVKRVHQETVKRRSKTKTNKTETE